MLKPYDVGGDKVQKSFVMLYDQHRGHAFHDKAFDLHSGHHVDKVQRFVPNIQVRAFAQAARYKRLFFWPSL